MYKIDRKEVLIMESLKVLSEEDINRIVEEKVQAILQSREEKKVCEEWIRLRNEINEWCHENANKQKNRSYQTLQNLIYSTLKFVTGVSRIDEIDENNIDEARRAWEFLEIHNPLVPQEMKLNDFLTEEQNKFLRNHRKEDLYD